METDRKWVIVRIDGKIAAISTDYTALAAITTRLAQQKSPSYGEIRAETVGFEQVWALRQTAGWEDLLLFGTDFQKRIWRKLWELTHPETSEPQDTEPSGLENESDKHVRLLSYSDFAELCNNRAGVRAVAHAIGLNPVAVIIPCHMVIPKETIDRIREIQKKAESTIFKGDDLCLKSLFREKGIDFGEYSLGRRLKRELISLELF